MPPDPENCRVLPDRPSCDLTPAEWRAVEAARLAHEIIGGEPLVPYDVTGMAHEIVRLRKAIHRYLQVDGSHGVYDAIELGRARRRLIGMTGDVERLTLAELRAAFDEQERSDA